MGLLDGFISLGSKTNKAQNPEGEITEGVSDLLPELRLDMPDEELLTLTKDWKTEWDTSEVKKEWEAMTKEAKDYYLGKQFSDYQINEHQLIDNAIFEAVETYLPQATRRNPEPQVTVAEFTKDDPLNAQRQAIAELVKQKLVYLADALKLRLKQKKALRHWMIYMIGIVKVGFSFRNNEIWAKPIHPSRIILDPKAVIDEDGYQGRFVGEFKSDDAKTLIDRFPEKEKFISDQVDGKLGTEVTYIEWNTPDYVCWTYEKEVLGKSKNIHWNYDEEVEEEVVDEMGGDGMEKRMVKGNNHFSTPRIPYVFLTVFNLGEKPVDDTSLIVQNIPLQDKINKRERQIDKNVDGQNGGMVVSGEAFTEDQAKEVSDVLADGGTIRVPSGPVSNAFEFTQRPALPADVFNHLYDSRRRLADLFGTSGSTASGISQEKTVRGKLVSKGLDTDRIGGGVTEYLEQMSDDIFNWFVQLMYVYYGLDIPEDMKLLVSVKEGSLLPKDSISEANNALELWAGGALDPITLFEKLEYPNPKESAKKLYLWKNAPQLLFQDDPEVAQVQALLDMQKQRQALEQMPKGEALEEPAVTENQQLLDQVPIP